MAIPSSFLIFLGILLLPAILATPSSLEKPYPCPSECVQQKETHFHMYLHQFPAWDNVTDKNEAPSFNMFLDNWLITMENNPYEMIIGHARGYHLGMAFSGGLFQTSHTYVFESGRFAGSTLQVLGLLDILVKQGELVIIGGTGAFSTAHGTIRYKEVQSTRSNITDVVRELEVHIFTLGTSPLVMAGAIPI
ncbi:unnamed protein product [Urochloa decumbens]|uniref:Dirigent protein n=1 Tax=Urochloa decumbens TaxID=240449 RepID=A0ABC9AJM8_9POAL